MSDLPEGLSESFFYKHPNGRQVELVNYRRYPDIDFVRKAKPNRKRLPGSIRAKRPTLVQRDGQFCHYCEVEMIMPDVNTIRLSARSMTIEHIVPRSMGGSNFMHNLVLACNKCNNEKGNDFYKCYCMFCESARLKFGEENASKK